MVKLQSSMSKHIPVSKIYHFKTCLPLCLYVYLVIYLFIYIVIFLWNWILNEVIVLAWKLAS